MSNIKCELPDTRPSSEEIIHVLKNCSKIAIVGISPKETRDSNKVGRYLLEKGYEIIPINPGQREIMGRPCYRSLTDIPFPVDMVNLFLPPHRVPVVVDQAIEIGVRAIWMQLGVVHNEAADRARRAGIQVVMNMCTMREHQKMAPPFPLSQ